MIRIGNGYDVHAFTEGDYITLGGIKIEHNKIRIEFENYVHNFKEVKKNIFDMIKEIMKKNKLKLLLSKQ